MKDIIINVDSTSHKVNFPDEFLGIGYENLQGNIIFQFDNNFIGGEARLEVSIDEESGIIPSLTHYENGYIVPIKSSLLTGTNVLMQLVIDETSLTKYTLTTDTQVNQNKTYYEKVDNDYLPVENPNAHDLPTYYEANTPVFKTDIFSLKVKDSINAQETIPEQYPTWINTFNILVATLNQKLLLVDQALTEMDNLNISVSNKVNGEVTITFTNKEGNEKVVKINDGRGIVSIIKTSTSGNIDTYTITYTDNTTSTFQVTNGIDGTDGVGIESIYLTGTSGLTDTYTILYTDGTTTEFQVKNGRGITKIEKISTNLLVDTYKITFNDGTTQNYEITNGKGIVSIEKTSTDGLTDIYTITYNDNTTTTFNVVNGKGIVSIEKTSTSGYVDTYTITYNDGTTTTYEVTNGEVSQAQLDALQDELNYYKTIVNALPKITGTGTNITLNNTANSILSNLLNPNIYQETTTGKQLLQNLNTSRTINGMTFTINNDGSITMNGTTTADTYFYFGVNNNPLQFNVEASKIYSLTIGNNTFPFRAFFRIRDAVDSNIFKQCQNVYGQNTNKVENIDGSFFTNGIVLATLFIYSGETANNFTIYPQFENSPVVTSYESYTGGIPAPNPQFPMPIHIISGDNTLIENGSQLFDKDNADIVTGYIDGTTGNLIIGGTSKATREYIPILPNTDMNISGFNNIVLAFYDKNKTFIERVLTASNSYTFNRNAYYIRIQGTGDTFNADTIMLNLGTTALPYKSYQKQTAQLNLPVENLFNPALLSQQEGYNTYDSSTGLWTTNGASAWFLSILYNVASNTTRDITKLIPLGIGTYTIKIYDFVNNTGHASPINYRLFNTSGEQLSTDNTANTTITITTTQKCYLDLCKTNSTGTLSFSKIQIEKGTKANSYTPYGTTPIEYCVIGNYADIFFKNVISSPLYNATLELDKWYLKKNTYKELIKPTGCTLEENGVRTNFSLSYLPVSSYPELYCNYFRRATSYAEAIGNTSDSQNKIGFNTTGQCLCNIYGYTTQTEYIDFFTNNDVYAIYPLATSTYTPLNDTLQSQLEYIYNQMLAYKGQTNISQINNDLPFIIDSTALKDLTNL